MKKTLLLALLGASTLAIASGKVELKNEFSSKVTKSDQGIKFDEKKAEHVLTASVTENNITAEMSLKLKGEEKGDKFLDYSEGIKEGYAKLAYNDKTVAGSLKYELKKALTAEGSYTYKSEPLTVKPAVKFVADLAPSTLELSNNIGYVVDDKLTLGNDIKLNTNLKSEKYATLLTVKGKAEYKFNEDIKLTDELTVEKSLNGHKKEIKYKTDEEYVFKFEKGAYISGSNKFTGEIKLGNEVKLEPVFELSALKISEMKDVDGSPTDEKLISINVLPSVKVSYTSEAIKGLKADATGKYNYKYIKDTDSYKVENEDVKEEEKYSSHLLGLDGKVSYDIPLYEGLTLTPALNLKYNHTRVNSANVEDKIKVISNELNTTLSGTVAYKMDKFSAKLGLESTFKHEGKVSERTYTEDEFRGPLTKKEIKVKKEEKFGYKSTNVKATLTLGYTW